VIIEKARSILRTRRHVRFDKPDDFGIVTPDKMIESFQGITRGITLAMVFIAFISLLIGGVGVMNIMLVSVTERTREIGVRMAIGAKGGDIRAQFLVEAVVLAVSGGAVGIACGIGIQQAVGRLAGWPVFFEPAAITLAFCFSAVVGITFGFYPALKASRLDPIEALRYE
jgi:ABC-type antimicrobial peptide transport system permease subunit